MRSSSEDGGLIRRAVAGDRVAFGELIRKHDRQLRGVVWTVVGSSSRTDEVMQTAYVKALRGIADFRCESSISTWLHSICYRTALDDLRRESIRRHEPLEAVHDLATATSVEMTVSAQLELEGLLAELGPDERAMLLLLFGFGYSYEETAAIVGRKRGTIASTVHRFRSRLAKSQDI